MVPGLAVLALVPGWELAAGALERPQRESLEALWQAPVEGLSVVEPGRWLRGRIDGLQVQARLRGLRRRLEVQLAPVPVDAERWGLTLHALAGEPRWALRGSRLTGWGPPREERFYGLLERGRALARMLHAQTVAPWQGYAAQHRLRLRGGVTHWADGARLRVEGRVRDVEVSAELLPFVERLRLRVTAQIPGGLPGRMRIYRRGARNIQRQHRPPVSLRDPILKDRVVAFGWLERDGRALLARPEVCGPLLEVLMDYPGSRIVDGAVTLYASAAPGTSPQGAVAVASDLARALGRR